VLKPCGRRVRPVARVLRHHGLSHPACAARPAARSPWNNCRPGRESPDRDQQLARGRRPAGAGHAG
jgi:hypothetical protein